MKPHDLGRKRANLFRPDGTIFVPLFVLFITGLDGLTLPEAFGRALSQFVTWPTAPVVWGQVLAINLLVYWFTWPAFRIYLCQLRSLETTPLGVDKAMAHLNALAPVVILGSVLLFAGGRAFLLMLDAPTFSGHSAMLMAAFGANLGQAAANGLFVGVLLALQFDHGLYRARQAVLKLGPRVPMAYRSLYASIFFVVAAMVVFFCFQVFSASASFFNVGRRADDLVGLGNGIVSGADLIIQSSNEEGIKATLQVLGVKLLLMLLASAQVLWLLKLLVRNPIDTVRGRLAVLNSPNPGEVKQIDIVKNDEFAAVYREINTLILWQQDRLDVTRRRLEAIIEFAADAILSFDQGGRIKLANPAVKAVFGWEPAALADQDLGALFPGGAPALAAAHAAGTVRSAWKRHDGSDVLLESSLSEAGGELWNTVILRDVTLQAELETTLKRARTEAERANQMKSEFLANMSHELRTPLNAILGFTQLLENDKNLTAGQVDRIRVISRAGEHLLGLINDILDISKIEAGKMDVHPTVFDLPQFVGDVQEMFALKCRSKGLTLYVETLEGVPRHVEGDLGKLRQILINLVGNAVKFTAEGGISVLVGPDGDRVRFAVKDTGRGIPFDEQERILQPFVQASTTDNEGGTGLGLAISSRYIAMMGGTLTVESAPEAGSTFSFSLPLPASTAAPETASAEDVAIAVKEGHEVAVLVVDDQVTNRLVLKEMLERAGFTVLEAANGQQAVERAREHRPPLIFMDIKMPVLDGYGAVEALKRDPDTAGLKVFALTASAFSHDEKRIAEAGFDGFLAKPFKQSALHRLIRDKGGISPEFETSSVAAPETGRDPEQADFEAAAAALSAQDRARLDDSAGINDFRTVAALAAEWEHRAPVYFAALKRAAADFDEEAVTRLLGGLK